MFRFSIAVCAIPLIAVSTLSSQQRAPRLSSAARQIAEAVTALPAHMREGATVLGYSAIGQPLVTLREGTNGMICLAPNPTAKDFHSACYQKGMEPFMARGRELRAQGIKGDQVDSVRFAEAREGKLTMPTQPSMLYQIFGGTFDAKTSTVHGGTALYVTYIPFATEESTGISAKPSRKDPWIMFPGTPKAHIMFLGAKMQ
ncbi:MAG TPA: hypothetical protein VJ867_04360 [Gemmatimonadaceae bacterium]|nr:hypothetical protein [Gemmatimonadaceae bacterium]